MKRAVAFILCLIHLTPGSAQALMFGENYRTVITNDTGTGAAATTHTYNNRAFDATIYILGNKADYGDIVCTWSLPTDYRYTYTELSENNYAPMRKMYSETLGKTFAYTESGRCNLEALFGPNGRIYVVLFVYRPAYAPGGDDLGIRITGPTITPPPTQTACSALIDPINFGVVPGGVPWVDANSNLNVTCSAATTIHVLVNGGDNLDDPGSGAIIRFNPTPGRECKTCSIPITVGMDKTPTRSGSYKWGVPVKIEFD